jgi:acyl carrier protein
MSLSDRDVLAAIAEVGREHLQWTGPIAPEMSLVEAFALDSLRQLTLVVELENRFRIRLDDEDASDVRTVGDLVALIVRKLGRTTPGTGAP